MIGFKEGAQRSCNPFTFQKGDSGFLGERDLRRLAGTQRVLLGVTAWSTAFTIRDNGDKG